jgi:hypothetical protein
VVRFEPYVAILGGVSELCSSLSSEYIGLKENILVQDASEMENGLGKAHGLTRDYVIIGFVRLGQLF